MSRNYEKLLEKATSHLLMEPDVSLTIQICDLIRQGDVSASAVLNSLKKKLSSTNPYTTEHALLVLESLVKNCGSAVQDELTNKAFCEFLHEFCKTTTHDNARSKLLELIQSWNYALRKNPKHIAMKELMIIMKAEGYKFPTLQESDAMFSADTAPKWVDGVVCNRCRVQFGLINRKHHCRACGEIFCNQCTSKTTTLPKYGIEKEVRVCDSCYDLKTKSLSSKSSSLRSEHDLPEEYLKSSLAQQKQEPVKKSDEELKEEEELLLAIALSQSEAEAKEKEKSKSSIIVNDKDDGGIGGSIFQKEEQSYPELQKYLDRDYWESVQSKELNEIKTESTPSAPVPIVPQFNDMKYITKENGTIDNLEDFIKTLKSQVEIFVNRMKSDSSRGRCIANDTSVQTLFMNITAMHSRLLCYIQEHDDRRIHFERIQDKLAQVKDARAALDALRDEHRQKMRYEAEEAERQRQLQMAYKLEVMRKKKQEYLQYQRQLALQRIQEQEREMKMRQQKQQYIYGSYVGSPVHGQPYQPNAALAAVTYPNYSFPQHVQTSPTQIGVPLQGPIQTQPAGHPTVFTSVAQPINGSNNPSSFAHQKMQYQVPGPVRLVQNQGPLQSNQAATLSSQSGIPSSQVSPASLPQGALQHQVMPESQAVGLPPNTNPAQVQFQAVQPKVDKEESTAELISFD